MTPEEIDRLAELHLVADDDGCIYGTEAFASAVEAATIEQCAKIVDEEADNARDEHYYPGVVSAFEDCADAIRALAKEKS
jgi:hypothetical protein